MQKSLNPHAEKAKKRKFEFTLYQLEELLENGYARIDTLLIEQNIQFQIIGQ